MNFGIKRVVIGMSGGVDSAVSALFLKKKGFDVVGVFMQNWDIRDETGHCSSERDREDAARICEKLGVPLNHVNFVKEYWNDVFSNLLKDYQTGYTPNPDIRCNEFIKFRAFYDYARNELAADAVATGHYTSTSFGPYLEGFAPGKNARLLKAKDPVKDQTFFLSRIPQDSLRRAMFPVGGHYKRDVIKIARENGLNDVANKKESMGICFIGSRRFQDFISEYVENKPGNFVDLETSSVVGRHNGIHHWTMGQRCKIGGVPKPYFVCRKDADTNDIWVVPGTRHPALFSRIMITEKFHWINPEWGDLIDSRGILECDFRFQHTKPVVPCAVFRTKEDRFVVALGEPARALTPGQFAVVYSKNECLGSARILTAGPSLYSLNREVPAADGLRERDLDPDEDDDEEEDQDCRHLHAT
ncbi:mitochondrial tRNA-specific 2-thiouridylase 1 [Athalia rosae]|uniref:mitochondrial tRNA-specific 2-thiouridylase 1 n=1 Tax=Athalia rosae TaxID=37344 RepID=UPI00203446CC|nr:mitochondrial tRNA-specific 2-thiouridylase 1 [Athalia rosae]